MMRRRLQPRASTSPASWASTSTSSRSGPRGREQLRERRVVQRGDDQQDRVGAGRARLGDLVRVDDEVFAQHRQARRRARAAAGRRAARRRTARRSAPTARSRRPPRRRAKSPPGRRFSDPARRRRAPLELGDAGDLARPAQRRGETARVPSARPPPPPIRPAAGRACAPSRSARVRARMSSRIMTRPSGAGRSGAAARARPCAPPPASASLRAAASPSAGRAPRPLDVKSRRRGHDHRAARRLGRLPGQHVSATPALSAGVAAAPDPPDRRPSGRSRPGAPRTSSPCRLPARPRTSAPRARTRRVRPRRGPPRPRRPERAERRGERLAALALEDADDVLAHARRVGQRPEQVEERAHAELLARPDRRAAWPRGARREQEAEPASRRQRSTSSGVGVGSHAERLEHVGAPHFDDSARLPCLATATPHAGDHDRRERRDVDVPRAVAAGAAGVDHALAPRTSSGVMRDCASRAPRRRARRPSRPSRAARRAARRSAPASPAPSMISPTTVGHLGARQVAAARSTRASASRDAPARSSVARVPSRKFASSFLPAVVMIDSGWNCTPSTGELLVAHAHDLVLPRSSP